MRSVSEHQRLKIIRCVILTLSVSFMVFVSLRHTSNVLYDFMFTDPSSMVDWDDHIQIAIVLKGKLIKSSHDSKMIIEHTCKNLIPMVVTRAMANSSKNHALLMCRI